MSKRFNEPVHILGVGCTRFGNLMETPELKGLTLQEMAAKAAEEALADAGLTAQDVDAVYIGNVTMQMSQLPATYSQLAKWLGTTMKAGVHIDAACSTTNVAASLAAMSVASGVFDRVLVVGLEATQSKPKEFSPHERDAIASEQMWLWTDQCVNQAYSVPQGYDIFPVGNAFFAEGYCRKYGVSIDDYDRGMLELCRTRRLHGSMNPKAIRQQTLDDEAKALGFNDMWDFWTSRYNPHVAWPSRLYSVVTPADGASAMVIGRGKEANHDASAPIEIKGFGISAMDLPWVGDDPTELPIDNVSFEKAYAMADIKPEEIEYLHTHDCTHIMSVCSAEASGYIPKGKSLEYAREGRLRFDGDRPMSTHGGRHAFGHAWAASAGSDTYEAVKQMRGLAGPRQIAKPPHTAVVHTHGYALISTVLVLQETIEMPDSLIKSYYDNLSEGKLIGLKCKKCGGIAFPPTAACPDCSGFEHTEVELSGRGEALFISHSMAPPPNPRFNDLAPYAYGHVKLEEGVFVEGIVTGVDIDPANLQKIFEAGPTPVEANIIEVEGLPILAFKLA